MSMRGWPQTFLVLSSLPFAVAGSIWLLAFMDYNLSTAVWVGLIAVAGVAAETGIVMVVYLDEAFARYQAEGRIRKPEDVDAAVIEGASARVRPLVMTVATTVLGLLPLLWEAGVGADVVHFIPERLRDGYGLQPAALDRLQSGGSTAGAAGIELAVTSSAALHQTFFLGHPDPVTARTLGDVLATTVGGRAPRRVRVPWPVVWLAAQAGQVAMVEADGFSFGELRAVDDGGVIELV